MKLSKPALALLVIGLIVVGRLLVGGADATPAPQQSTVNTDARYLASIPADNRFGPAFNPASDVIGLGHQVCNSMERTDMSSGDMIRIVAGGSDTDKEVDAQGIVVSAIAFYCPRYANR